MSRSMKSWSVGVAGTFRCLSLVAAVLVGEAAWAGTGNGFAFQLLPTREGVVFFKTVEVFGRAACNTSNRWVIDARTPGGRAMLATVLKVQALNQGFSVQGNGSCDVSGDAETVQFIVAP